MASIVAAGFEDASRLDDNDRERLVAWFLQHMFMKDTLYHQYVDGILPEHVWKAHELVTVGATQCDAWCRVWDAGHMPVSEEFREYVEGLRANNASTTWSYANKARLFD